MKKVFGIMLSLLIALELCGMSIYAIENSYTDIKNHWAESSIKRWSEYDIVQGSNGEFEPNGQLTCAQLATILTRLLKLPAAPDAGFTDNPYNAWYYDAINRCAAGGILKGNGDGTVTPNAPISRERAMVMLSRALGIEALDSSTNLSEFSDAALVSPYAQGYIAALIEAGIVGGVTADCLAPQENITRAVTVTVLDRAIGIYANENGKEIDASNAAGIILIAAENVKVINAPSGVSVIVAEGVDHATVNGVSVVGGSSYVVKEKESKPVSGGSGGSTSGGSSSGGDVPSPSYAISNLHFEQSGDDYVLAWNGTGRDSFYYNVYLKLSEDSDWSYKGATQDAKFKMDMLHSSKGVKVEAYINETDETPVAVAEDLSLEVNVTPVKSEPDNLSATFTKEGNQYSATFTGLPAGKFAVVLFQKGDTVDTPGQTTDEAGNVSFLIPSDENDLIENGTYMIYSYDNYVLNGNQLSYTVYQHCEPTPCLTTNSYIRNVHLEKNGNAYVWTWDSPEDYSIYYRTYVKYENSSSWSIRIGQIRRHWVWADVETNGGGFRVEAYRDGDELTPIASAEIPDITYLATNAKQEREGISATFTKSNGRYTANFTGLPANTLVAVDFFSSDKGDKHRSQTDAQGSISFLIPSDENDLIENGTYTVYSYDNYVLNGNQLSYTVYQHCEPTGCIIEDIPEIGNAMLDIYSFAAKADIDNVINKIGAIHFDRPYTVNLEDGADISEWFSGIPDGLRILYKKGNSSSNKILFEIRGTPTNTVTNEIHYLRCVIPSNTIFVDGQLYPLKIQPNIFCSQIYVCDSFEYINSVRSWIEWDKVEKSDDIEDVIESLCEALRSTENTTTDAVRSYDDNTIYLTINVSTDRGYKFSEDVDIDLSCYSGFQYKFSTLTTLEGEEKPYKTEMDFGIDVEIDRDKLAEIISD